MPAPYWSSLSSTITGSGVVRFFRDQSLTDNCGGKAKVGETLYVKFEPAAGNKLAWLIIKDSNGNMLQKGAAANGYYTFTVPADSFTVSAKFDAIS